MASGGFGSWPGGEAEEAAKSSSLLWGGWLAKGGNENKKKEGKSSQSKGSCGLGVLLNSLDRLGYYFLPSSSFSLLL